MDSLLDITGLKTVIDWVKSLSNTKQDTLVSSQNIKTINGASILGKGDITIKEGSDENSSLSSLKVVATATTAEKASAVASLENNTLKFSFGIPKGEKGDKGDKGAKGESGDAGSGSGGGSSTVAILTRQVMIFTASDTQPETPVGGSWNVDDNTLLLPMGWDLSPNGMSGTIWMSTNTFSSDTGKLISAWSTPVRISGKDGKAGADADNIEFIYRLTQTSLKAPTKPVSVNEDDYVPTGWTNHPQGITASMQAEWMSQRTKTEDDWGEFSEPALWSRWGVDGRDGDGVEYIYKRTNVAAAPDTPTVDTTTTEYQTEDYVPSGWTDDPTGVDETYMWEWICSRKYSTLTGQWKAFTGGSVNPAKAALWAKYGERGNTGYSIRTLYAKASDASVDMSKYISRYNINPGSIWSTNIPSYKSPEAIFAIQATITWDNDFAYPDEGWQGPYLLTGVQGETGSVPNWKTYIYKESSTMPEKPTWDYPEPQGGWKDYPTGSGQWWQCIGTVDGTTGLVTEWSTVLPVNGQDGVAQDGKKTEFRFKINSSSSAAPDYTASDRQGGDGWTIEPPTVGEGEYLWMITATIAADGNLYTQWSAPVRISGEKGERGPAGPASTEPGPAGIPGVSIQMRYSIGDDSAPTADSSATNLSKRTPNDWSLTVPSVTSTYPYIWCIQSRINYQSGDDPTDTSAGILATGSWGNPIRLSGLNGTNATGSKGQIIYPAGIYDVNTSYTTNGKVAPYVYDTSDGNYYVLDEQMTWLGTEQKNLSPSGDTSGAWIKFEKFSAIFANVAMINNGLFGSAVFNGDWMFSQQGVYKNTDYNSDSSTIVDYSTAIDAGKFDANYFYSSSYWCPAMALNFKTGTLYLNYGATVFTKWGETVRNLDAINIVTSTLETNTFTQNGVSRKVSFNTNGFEILGGSEKTYYIYKIGDTSFHKYYKSANSLKTYLNLTQYWDIHTEECPFIEIFKYKSEITSASSYHDYYLIVLYALPVSES